MIFMVVVIADITKKGLLWVFGIHCPLLNKNENINQILKQNVFSYDASKFLVLILLLFKYNIASHIHNDFVLKCPKESASADIKFLIILWR